MNTPASTCLDIRQNARSAPDAPCLVMPDVSVTYGEMATRVDAALERWPRGTAAIRCEPTLEALGLFYAALAAGRPTLLIHPKWTPVQVAQATELVGASAIFDDRGFRSIAPRPVTLHPDASLLLATSGSTGTFKIVQHSHSSLTAAAEASRTNLPLAAVDRWLLSLPYAHVGGVSVLVRCMLAQVPVVLAHGSFADPGFIDCIEDHGCTLYSLVPTQLRDLVTFCAKAGRVPPTLRHVLVGGAPADLRLRTLAHDVGIRALYTYGMTEMGSQIATQRPHAQNHAPQTVDVGQPLRGVEVRVDDHQRLHVRGPSLMLGYVGAPPLRSDPASHSEWFCTNDRARWLADGSLEILGRLDDMVITGGENVDPLAVEQVLMQCPWLKDAAVCGVPDERWGQRLAALVVMEAGTDTGDPSSLILNFARQRLPGYAVPKSVHFVQEIPHLGIGKVDRARLLGLLGDQEKPWSS